MQTNSTCLATLALLVLASSAAAHHNSAPIYDGARSITVEGTVKEFRLINPHARVYVTVVDGNGKSQEWLAEGANAGVLRRLGWKGDELKPGDRIKLTGAPARDGSPKLEWRVITRADGTQLGGGNGLPSEREELLQRLEEQRRTQRSSDRK
jgi:hypothetical protein